MPQSLCEVFIHIVFSTKDRQPFIASSIEPKLHNYLSSVCQNNECRKLAIGGMPDHIHILTSLSRKIAISTLIKELKTCSSKWMKDQHPSLSQFYWQRGFGVFSTAPSMLNRVIEYIDNQKEHHKKVSFQEEYRKWLKGYGIDFNERYVWD